MSDLTSGEPPKPLPKRGLIPSPRSVLAAATPHVATAAPATFIVIPAKISAWGNVEYPGIPGYGNCVSAEEAFAKACNTPEIFISDEEVIRWSTQHGALNGSQAKPVLTAMQSDGFHQDGSVYDDGAYHSVDWTHAATLQSAISQGPVKIGVAADQLQAAWEANNSQTGWVGLGFKGGHRADHCVSLCGYGSLDWLAQQLQANLPAGADGTLPGYAVFSWNSIGILDAPSMLAVTDEAWLRSPTTIIR